MAHWLIKEEPSHYSYSDLARDSTTEWSGVHNALALRHLRGMRPGDTGFYYHTGSQKSIVGVFEVASAPEPDPADPRGSWRVTVRAQHPLLTPVPLRRIREDARFSDFALVRISRLSVLPVPDGLWTILLRWGASGSAPRRLPTQSGPARPRRKRASARRRSRGST